MPYILIVRGYIAVMIRLRIRSPSYFPKYQFDPRENHLEIPSQQFSSRLFPNLLEVVQSAEQSQRSICLRVDLGDDHGVVLRPAGELNQLPLF